MSDFSSDFNSSNDYYSHPLREEDDGIIWDFSQDDLVEDPSEDFYWQKFSSPVGVISRTSKEGASRFSFNDAKAKMETPRKSIQEIIESGEIDSHEELFQEDNPHLLRTIYMFVQILKFQNEEILKELNALRASDKKKKARFWYRRRKKLKSSNITKKRPKRWRKVQLPPRLRWRKKNRPPNITRLDLDQESFDLDISTEFTVQLDQETTADREHILANSLDTVIKETSIHEQVFKPHSSVDHPRVVIKIPDTMNLGDAQTVTKNVCNQYSDVLTVLRRTRSTSLREFRLCFAENSSTALLKEFIEVLEESLSPLVDLLAKNNTPGFTTAICLEKHVVV